MNARGDHSVLRQKTIRPRWGSGVLERNLSVVPIGWTVTGSIADGIHSTARLIAYAAGAVSCAVRQSQLWSTSKGVWSGCAALVPMVQSADFRKSGHMTSRGRLNEPCVAWGVFLE